MIIKEPYENNEAIKIILQRIIDGHGDEFPKSIHISDLLSDDEINEDILESTLSYFECMGLIEINKSETILIISKYPYIALKALLERLKLSEPITENMRENQKKKYYKNFTYNLELVRYKNNPKSDPIHSRKIVNLIIKGKAIKNWKKQDVFLHVFHSDWNKYHLIGLGERGEENLDHLISKAMKERMDLDPSDYEIDPEIKPDPISFISLSDSHGGLTQYNLDIRVIKKINLDLNKHIINLIKTKADIQKSTFKWFSLDEVRQRINNDGSIMESTIQVLNQIDHGHIPLLVKNAKTYEHAPYIKISSNLNNKINAKRCLLSITILVLLLIFINSIDQIKVLIDEELLWLDNLSNISQIISIVLTIIFGINAIR